MKLLAFARLALLRRIRPKGDACLRPAAAVATPAMSAARNACLGAFAVSAAGALLLGCTPHVGDHCNVNSDCSLQGTLVCDNSQPNGYCTLFNCAPNKCQDQAVCVLTHAGVPGCPYDDYQSPSRTARSMCLAHCSQDSDCRTGDGYVCEDQSSHRFVILDSNQNQKVCVLAPATLPATLPDAGVCQPSGPVVPPLEAGVHLEDGEVVAPDGGTDAAGDAVTDAAGEGGVDAGSDGATDAVAEGGSDGGGDAPGGD
jgi:hypothetical protein